MACVDAIEVLNRIRGAVVLVERMPGAELFVPVHVPENVRPMLGGVKNALPHLVTETQNAASRFIRPAIGVILDVLHELAVEGVQPFHDLAFVLAIGKDEREDAS